MESKNGAPAIDVSSFLLFEATGDSEFLLHPNVAGSDDSCGHVGSAAIEDEADQDDDAESCSYEHYSYGCSNVWARDSEDDGDGGDVVEDLSDEENEDYWLRTQETREHGCGERRGAGGGESSCVSDEVDSFDTKDRSFGKNPNDIILLPSNVHLSETEKNRLFWEACLAS